MNHTFGLNMWISFQPWMGQYPNQLARWRLKHWARWMGSCLDGYAGRNLLCFNWFRIVFVCRSAVNIQWYFNLDILTLDKYPRNLCGLWGLELGEPDGRPDQRQSTEDKPKPRAFDWSIDVRRSKQLRYWVKRGESGSLMMSNGW
jgi:hypothetical protein